MVQRMVLRFGASGLFVLTGACTLATGGIDHSSGAGGASVTVGAGTGGTTSTSTSSSTTTTTGTGGAPSCTSDAQCSPPGACVKYTCTAGACAPTFAAQGTPVAGAPPGPCKALVCDGAGATTIINDDAQTPSDANPCTVDACENGKPKHPPVGDGAPCGGNLTCTAGMCMGCSNPAQCPVGDTCQATICTAGACGFETASKDGLTCAVAANDCFNDSVCSGGACTPSPKPPGLFSDGVDHNCMSGSCDGNGSFAVVADDSDVPSDPNAGDCTVPACKNGMPVSVPAPDNQSCGNGNKCCNGACQWGNCCPVAQKCGGFCCAVGQSCGNNGFCCDPGNLCGGACCNQTCLNDSVCCFNSQVCNGGTQCCAFGKFCQMNDTCSP